MSFVLGKFGVSVLVALCVAGSTSTLTLKFIPRQNRFHGLETWLTVDNRALCAAACLSLPRCAAFAWYGGRPQECLVLRDIWGPEAPLSGGVFYGPTTLTGGKKLLHFPISSDYLWGDVLQGCLDRGLDLLQTPSNARDANIVASLGVVALDAKKMTEEAAVLTHDGRDVDTSQFKEEPDNNFGSKQHCLMADHFSLYWIICDEYYVIAKDIVCELP